MASNAQEQNSSANAAPAVQLPPPERMDPGYTFPTDKLKRRQTEPDKTPLVLVGPGSFSPITFLHLRMFEMAADYIRFNTKFEVVGAYLSPVSDAYLKPGLAAAHHRLAMCEAAVAESSWIMVDAFETAVRTESGEPDYVPTAQVLGHLDHEINDRIGIESVDGTRVRARICLLAGADLIQTMSTPGLWAPQDIEILLGKYGAFIIERTGTDVDEALSSLKAYEDNIWVINQTVQNDISSTKVRLFIRRDMSVRYLIPNPVIAYIEEHGLYEDEGKATKGKEKDGSHTAEGEAASAGPSKS